MVNFCTLYSGSSGNCSFIASQNTKILIDAGKSGKAIETAISKIGFDINQIDAILVTHEHSDHTKGVGILSRKYNISVYANKGTWDGMKEDIGLIKDENIKYFTSNEGFKIGDIEINPFSIPHDAADPVGFNFYIDSKKITTATDIGHINDNLFENLKNSDVLLIESNHDEEMVKVCRYPYFLKKRILGDHGHLSNTSTGELLCKLRDYGVNRVILGHLSHENNFPELAYKEVSNILQSNNILIGKDIKLEVAQREKESIMYAV